MRLTAEILFFPLVTLLVFLSLWACHRVQQFSMREGFLLRKFKGRPSAEIPDGSGPVVDGAQGTLVNLSKEIGVDTGDQGFYNEP